MIEGTVKLNGYWYNLASKVVGAYHSRMPGKVNTGPDAFDKEQFLSNWIISDQRGGIGIDEMDESVHADRCWWTNLITDYDGHMTSPRLATALTTPNLYGSTWTSPTGNEAEGTWSNIPNSYDENTGTYASQTIGGSSTGPYLTLNIAATSCNRVRLWWDRESADVTINSIQAYYEAGWHDITAETSGTGAWIYYKITTTPASDTPKSVTSFRIRFTNAHAADSKYARVHEVDFGQATTGDIVRFCNFNGKKYMARHMALYKLNSGRTGYDTVKSDFPAAITDIFTGPNGSLLIYLGDATNYYYMTTAEAFTQTDVNDATLGILWDSKAWKLDADGNWWYSATADNDSTPTWTSQTGITDIPSQIERLEVGKDGDGEPVIYCSTNSWLKVWDFTNNKWLNTEVKLYGNQYHGKGFVYWNAAHYLSYGIGVKQYSVGSTGTLSDVGLNRDGGLPAEYNGIIMRLIDGGDQMFALVDASLVTGTAQSGLYAFTGRAWRCWWADSSNDGAMHDAIVSSAQSAYAVYWDCGGVVYYIDMPQGLSNPKYLTGTQTYAASGIYLSSWFDGGNQAFQKLSKAVVSYAKLITTTETIVIKYRTNKTYTDRDTGWTTLDTLNAAGDNGEVVNQIASGAGSAFNSFQFRLDFARGSTTTLSPDMLALTLGHRLITQGNWSWTMTLVIDNSHNTTPKAKWDNLESAIESRTDVPFIFRFDPDETHYCSFLQPREIMAAGKEYTGEITVQVLEPWLP